MRHPTEHVALQELPIFLINLDRSPDRLAAMDRQLAAMGLSYTRLAGIDGTAHWEHLSAQINIPQFERNVGRKIMIGEVGCYASHIAAWDALLATKAPAALILEDDVVFHEVFPAALKVALETMEHWDLLKLNVIRAKQPIRQQQAGAWTLTAYLGPFTGMGAYLVTRETARRLRPAMMPPTRPIDHELDRPWMHDIRHFGLTPFPSHVDDGGHSTISGTGFEQVEKFKGRKRLTLHGLRLMNHLRKLWFMLRRRQIF